MKPNMDEIMNRQRLKDALILAETERAELTLRPRLPCECRDAGCPAHRGANFCRHAAYESQRVYRIDHAGSASFIFCEECRADALESGVFGDKI